MAENEPHRRTGREGRTGGPPRTGERGWSSRVAAAAGALAFVLRDPVVLVLVLAGFVDGISGNPAHWIVLYGAAFALGRHALLERRASDAGELPLATPGLRLGGAMRDLFADPSDEPRATARRLVFVPLALLAALAYAVVVGGFGRYSWPVTTVVVLTGVAVLVVSWPGPLNPRPEPAALGTVGTGAWLTVFIGLGLWELTQLLLQPNLTTDSWAHPTLSVLSDPILATHPGRTIGLFVWLLFGWFLVRR
jgi:hypothetical protein